MVYLFNEPDGQKRMLMRTLLKQELLSAALTTFRGFMLPSTVHGDRAAGANRPKRSRRRCVACGTCPMPATSNGIGKLRRWFELKPAMGGKPWLAYRFR